MTREEVLAMDAGEEMDDLVHVRVMGECLHGNGFESDPDAPHDSWGPTVRCKLGCGHRAILGMGMNAVIVWPSPEYSTDIANAWKVLEKLRERFPRVAVVSSYDEWSVGEPTGYDGPTIAELTEDRADRPSPATTASDVPLAICRAALLATL